MLFVGQRGGGRGRQVNCKWFGRWCREISPSSHILSPWLGRLIGWMGMLTKGNEMGRSNQQAATGNNMVRRRFSGGKYFRLGFHPEHRIWRTMSAGIEQ